MKRILLFISLLLIIIIFSCKITTKPQEKPGEIPLNISLQPAFDNGFDVTKVEAILSKDNLSQILNLTIEADSAKGTFTDLEPGVYTITVNLYDHENLIATGSAEAEVKAGETAYVHITIHFIDQTGDLVIIVDWVVEKNFPDSILFVGNSYTYFNGGLDAHFKRFAESAHNDWHINTSKVAFGGYTLGEHYNNPTSLATIASATHDYVVLQEQSTIPIEEPDSMYYYATLLDETIKNAGAKTVFFMTWAKKNNPESIEQIANSYEYISQELDAELVPVGRAFEKAMQIAPQIELYNPDQNHPSPYGTYLAICTFFAFFYDENPIGVEYCNVDDITAQDKETIQYIAWKTYLDYSN